MTVIEITLLVLGAIIFAASFVVPELKSEPSDKQQKFSEDEVKKVIEREMEHVRDRVDEVVEETIDYTIEKTERSLSKISNEKIMAVNEYSDTVLEEINKNHKEVMFLYDMLNDKQTDLNNTVRKVEATKEEAVAAVTVAANATVNMAVAAPVQQMPETRYSQLQETEQPDPFEEETDPFAGQPESFTGQTEESAPEPIFHRLAEGVDIPAVSVHENAAVKEMSVSAIAKKPVVKKSADKSVATTQKTEKPVSTKAGTGSVQAMGGKNNNRRILDLHRAGKSDIEIAKELGLGLGEVKLVIDLFEGA